MRLRVDRSCVALVCVLCSVVLLGSQLASPALAQSPSTQTSMLVFLIFDVFRSNQTKISITNNGGSVAAIIKSVSGSRPFSQTRKAEVSIFISRIYQIHSVCLGY